MTERDDHAKLRASATALLLCCASLPSTVLAQDRSGSTASDTIIVTGIGSPEDIDRTARAVTLIDRDRIERQQAVTVSDLISTTAGVTASRNGGIGGLSTVRIRGAEGDQTLVLIDGVRLNDPSAPGGGFDFGNLLVGTIERIEILRGPNSVPWGSQALGGVVNIETARPAEEFGGAAHGEYGFKDRATLAGHLGGRVGPVSASFGGGYFRDDGISAFRDGGERDGFRQYAANGRVEIALSQNLSIDLRGYYADGRARIDGFPPPFFGFADTAEFATTRQITGHAGARLQLFDGRLKNRFAFTLSDINRDNFDAPGNPAPSFLARGRTERIEYQGDARLAGPVRAVFGAEHERSRFSDGFSVERTNVTSGYVQLIVDPVESVTISGGARIDDHRSYGTETTLSASVAWRPSAGTVVRTVYGEGFKAPTLFQLFSFFGNTLLQPETARSYEIGIEQSLIDDRLRLGATLFQRNTRNQIDFISCFGQTTGICTNRPFGTYDNVDLTRAKGIEAFVRLAPTSRLVVEANYSLIDAKDRSTGLRLLRRPEHSLNVSLDWAARDWLNIGASLQTISDSADSDFQTFTRTSLDGYTLVGLRASVPLGDRLEFYGRVENVFDERYEQVSGYGTYGRNAHVGVRVKF